MRRARRARDGSRARVARREIVLTRASRRDGRGRVDAAANARETAEWAVERGDEDGGAGDERGRGEGVHAEEFVGGF